jgi:hypothetical protein
MLVYWCAYIATIVTFFNLATPWLIKEKMVRIVLPTYESQFIKKKKHKSKPNFIHVNGYCEVLLINLLQNACVCTCI